jgi:hypothetical protein
MASKEQIETGASSPIEDEVRSLKNTASPKDGDAALAFLRSNVADGETQAIDEKALVRKIDWMIMPLMWGCYFLQYLDKTLINYAVRASVSTGLPF